MKLNKLGPQKATAQRFSTTEGLQHRREYECSNPTSQTLRTLCDRTKSEDLAVLVSGKGAAFFEELDQASVDCPRYPNSYCRELKSMY